MEDGAKSKQNARVAVTPSACVGITDCFLANTFSESTPIWANGIRDEAVIALVVSLRKEA
jgi:hypothetical protein